MMFNFLQLTELAEKVLPEVKKILETFIILLVEIRDIQKENNKILKEILEKIERG